MSSDLQCPLLEHLKILLDASHLAILDPSSLELLWLRFNSPPVGARDSKPSLPVGIFKIFPSNLGSLTPWPVLDVTIIYYNLSNFIRTIVYHLSKVEILVSEAGPPRCVKNSQWLSLCIEDKLLESQVERRDFIVTRGDRLGYLPPKRRYRRPSQKDLWIYADVFEILIESWSSYNICWMLKF